MYSLFISTYNEKITIGLIKDNILLTQKEEISNRSHSILLVPMIQDILNENGIEPKTLNEILVVNGPGSFTGIRLGITVAKTLAYTLNIDIKTITSIEAIAASIEEKNKTITINDSKGKYIGIFKNNKLINELIYLKEDLVNDYLSSYSYKIYSDASLDILKIYEYSKKLPKEISHNVKAIYIKEIEALNGK